MDSNGSVASRSYSVWLNGSGFVHLTSSSDVLPNIQSCIDTDITTDPISLNTWYHYVGVIDRSSRVMTIFLGGDEKMPGSDMAINCTGATKTPSNEDAVQSVHPVKIGGQFSSFSLFDGQIDDVRIYNGVLTDAEVTSLYDSGRE
jgi:hypothetical protein